MTIPNDIARCPGKAMIQGAHIVTDPYCTGCKRLQAGVEDGHSGSQMAGPGSTVERLRCGRRGWWHRLKCRAG